MKNSNFFMKNRLFGLLLMSILISGMFSCNPILEVMDTRVVEATFSVNDVEEGDSSFLSITVTEGEDSCDYFVSWESGSRRDSVVISMKLKEESMIPLDVFDAGNNEVTGRFRRADGGANIIEFSTVAKVKKKAFQASFDVADNNEGEASILNIKLNAGDSTKYVLKYSIDGLSTEKVTLDLVKNEVCEIELGCLSAGDHLVDAELSRKDGYGVAVATQCTWSVLPKVFKFVMSVNDIEEGDEPVANLVLTEGDKASYVMEFLIDKKNAANHKAVLGKGESCEVRLPVVASGVHTVEARIRREDGLGTTFSISNSFGVGVKSFDISLDIKDIIEGCPATASLILKEGDEVEYQFVVFVDEVKIDSYSALLEKGKAFQIEIPAQPTGKHNISIAAGRSDGLGTVNIITGTYEVTPMKFSFEATVSELPEGESPTVKINLTEGEAANYSYVISIDNERAGEGSDDFVVGEPKSIKLSQTYSSGYHEFKVNMCRTDGLGTSVECIGTFNVVKKIFSIAASVAAVTSGQESVLVLTLKEGETSSYDVVYSVDSGEQKRSTVSMAKGSSHNIALGKLKVGSHKVSGNVKRTDGLGEEKDFAVTFVVNPDLSPDEVVFSKNKFSLSMDESVTVSVTIEPSGSNQSFDVTRTDSGSAKATYSVSGKNITVKGGATGGTVKLKVTSTEDPNVYEILSFTVKHRLALVLDVTCKANEGPWLQMPTTASMKFVTWTGTINTSDPTMKGVVLNDFTESYNYKANVYIHANPTSMTSISLKGDQPNFYWDSGTDWTYNGTTQSGRQWCLWKNRIRIQSNITSSPFKAASVSSRTNLKSSLTTLVNPATDNKKTVDQGYLIWNNNHRKWFDGSTDWIYAASSPGKDEPVTNAWKAFYMTVSDIELNWDSIDVKYILHMYRTKPNGNWYNGGYWWQPVDNGNWAVPVAESDKK